ncbi:DUF4169 family protein [Pelagovum pacificum]|uniref:DUF4169 family protein n=1 Tax=Pelagovum pacificum TaxID=2588711 RepID=A0A5C5GAM7_9RHOB|nr:DUF4169 family protein [Pelagovum pacificum]QQA41339.1 DUF4169 family protein [Pelagovum pacificum]TNY31855.1 DUF4169 family protein [Pelagovum pacificum]
MSVVNFNKARKVRARADAKKQADENAVKHGRTKAQRMLDAAREQKLRERLDGQKFDDV